MEISLLAKHRQNQIWLSSKGLKVSNPVPDQIVEEHCYILLVVILCLYFIEHVSEIIIHIQHSSGKYII